MKIIVVSDTHGHSGSLDRVMEFHSDADAVIHCGDSRGEMANVKTRYPDKKYYEVRGNCDFGSNLPLWLTFNLDGLKFMVTHGHAYNVKFGLSELIYAARQEECDMVFYGHTHIPHDEIINGMHVFNPGSCGGWGASFGIVETRGGQILSNLVYLRKL